MPNFQIKLSREFYKHVPRKNVHIYGQIDPFLPFLEVKKMTNVFYNSYDDFFKKFLSFRPTWTEVEKGERGGNRRERSAATARRSLNPLFKKKTPSDV